MPRTQTSVSPPFIVDACDDVDARLPREQFNERLEQLLDEITRTGREIKKGLKNVPIYSAIREAQRAGKAAQKIAHQDIRALLAEPLADARKRLGIKEPTQYNRAHEIMRAGGVDPYDLLGQQKAAA